MLQSTVARAWLISSLIGLSIVIVLIAESRYRAADTAKDSLIHVYHILKLGRAPTQALTYARHNRDLTERSFALSHTQHGLDGITAYEIRTPLQFGAKNWRLILVSVEDRVVGFGIRTEDSFADQPVGAPDDQVDKEFREMWNKYFVNGIPLGAP